MCHTVPNIGSADRFSINNQLAGDEISLVFFRLHIIALYTYRQSPPLGGDMPLVYKDYYVTVHIDGCHGV